MCWSSTKKTSSSSHQNVTCSRHHIAEKLLIWDSKIITHFNSVVSNHLHSVKNFLFSSAKPRDFHEMFGTGLPVSMYTVKTPIDKCHFNVIQLKELFTFSVKDRYQLNYFICIKDFNAQTITSLKLNLLYFFIYCCQHHKRKTTCLDIFLLLDRQ